MGIGRSENMSRIKGKNTGPEVRLRKALWAAGMRYRKHAKTPAGRPDVVFPGKKVAVFIDGCFWHGCPTHYVRPRSREEFWAEKLSTNVGRDRRQTLQLEEAGWKVVRVWEHEVYEDVQGVVELVRSALGGAVAVREDWRVEKVIALDEATNQERRTLAQLRDASVVRDVDGRRYTTKWKRPKD